MKKITRREVLAGLASAPIVHGVINPVLKHVGHSKCSPTRLLKVYVHGASVLDFRPPHIHVLFPSVYTDTSNSIYAHEYRVGDDTDRAGSLMAKGARVRLEGVVPHKPISRLDETSIPFVQVPTKLPMDMVYYCVSLPTPNRLLGCRTIPGNCGPIIEGGQCPKLKSLSLLLKLEYVLKQTDLPVLLGSDWEDNGADTQCIHLRGEPGYPGVANDSAMMSITAILGKSLSVSDNYLPAFACPGTDDEKSLVEIRDTSGAACADTPCSMPPPNPPTNRNRVHPANCVGVGNCPSCT